MKNSLFPRPDRKNCMGVDLIYILRGLEDADRDFNPLRLIS